MEELLPRGFLDLHGSMSPCQGMDEEFLQIGHQYFTSSREKENLGDSTERIGFWQSFLDLLGMRKTCIYTQEGSFLVAYSVSTRGYNLFPLSCICTCARLLADIFI